MVFIFLCPALVAMTEGELKAQLRSLGSNETLDVSDDLLAGLYPRPRDAYFNDPLEFLAATLECQIEKGPAEQTTRFVKVAKEHVSERDRKAIDLYYEYEGPRGIGGAYGWGHSDVDRRKWMDYKDLLRGYSKKDFIPIAAGLVGFGAAAVLFTPFGWIGASGVAAAVGFNKLKKEWRKERTLIAYGRTFVFDRKGAVVEATRDGAE
jgi:hypothetical protein